MKPKKSSSAKIVGPHSKVGLKSKLATKRVNRSVSGAMTEARNSSCKNVAYLCSGCNESITRDKFLLEACDKYWHENCFKCSRCHCKLTELGPTFFHKFNMNLCRQDYLEMFGKKGVCSVCEQIIYPTELVMRAKQNVYHLECFACQLCSQRFCVGDRFYLCENKIICQYDYAEHIMPLQKFVLLEDTVNQLYPSITSNEPSCSSNINMDHFLNFENKSNQTSAIETIDSAMTKQVDESIEEIEGQNKIVIGNETEEVVLSTDTQDEIKEANDEFDAQDCSTNETKA